MSRLSLIVYLAFVVVAYLFFSGLDEKGERRPIPERPLAPFSPPQPEAALPARPPGAPLPGPGAKDPLVNIEASGPCQGTCTGTAFAIDDRGHWLTARHVVDGCGEVGLMTGPRKAVRVTRIVTHPRADVSLLEIGVQAPPLAIDWGPLLRRQDGFHLGYPRGEPGDVHGRLLGRVKVRTRGRRSGWTEPGIAWAEVARRPGNNLPLGGLSGGPVVNTEGHVIGVAIAASPRRGRVVSAAQRSLREVVEQAKLGAEDLARPNPLGYAFDPRSYAENGKRLRSALTVAKIVCLAETRKRRRRPSVW